MPARPGRHNYFAGFFRRPDRPCRLKEGSHKLDLWPNCEGDGSDHSRTPSKSVATEEAHRRDKVGHPPRLAFAPSKRSNADPDARASDGRPASLQLLKLFEGTSVARVDWLDRAAMEALQLQTKARGALRAKRPGGRPARC